MRELEKPETKMQKLGEGTCQDISTGNVDAEGPGYIQLCKSHLRTRDQWANLDHIKCTLGREGGRLYCNFPPCDWAHNVLEASDYI